MSDQHPYGHMVHEHFVRLEREVARRRAEALARVTTPARLRRLQADVRRKIRGCFPQLPARTPLNARTTGVIEGRRYRIEKVIYESRPDLPVTASLYVPAGASTPRPAVLGTCGHSNDGKACDVYQAFAAHLAGQGYVVLIYDPISQGERLQYLHVRGRARPRGCTREHNMMGNQMTLVGDFLGSWRAWDGIRGLDYLLSRPEVDRSRVGVTGNSGGGTMTTFLTALDDRFTMAAPSCFVTPYLRNLENELPQDAEQCPPGLMGAGLEMADFFVARIPRPTLLLGQANDFFDVRGLREVYAELRRLYGIVGRQDDVQLFIGPGDHGYGRENREAMYRFFNRHAGVRASGREPSGWRPVKEQDLFAAPRGQVGRIHSARKVFEFTAAQAARCAGGRKPLSDAALRRRIAARLHLPRRAVAPAYRVVHPLWPARRGVRRGSAFAVETAPDVVALVHMMGAKGEVFSFPRCRQATVYVPHVSAAEDAAAGHVPNGKTVFAVEVRGTGQLAAATCSETGFFNTYGADYMYAHHAAMLGQSYGGQRVHDLLSALDLLAANGCRDVHLVGRGLGAVWATFAACLHRAVRRVTLHNALRSYHELTQADVYRWPLSSLVAGVLNDFDLPDCHRLLRRTARLKLVEPWDAMMKPVRLPMGKKHGPQRRGGRREQRG